MYRTSTSNELVYVVDGARTPFLKAKNKPGPFSASDLATRAGQSLLDRVGLSAEQIDNVVIGSVMSHPDETNIARLIALRLGCSQQTPAYTVQRNCASGLQALHSGMRDIQEGRSYLTLAGGTEAMSHAPLIFNSAFTTWLGAWMSAKTLIQRARLLSAVRPSFLKPIISILRGLNDPMIGWSMGQTAENLAYRFAVNRLEMDTFAVNSHHRATQAMEQGLYQQEIVPLVDHAGRAYHVDEGVRADANIEKLATLKPFFDKIYGHVTAGNSSQITDGAAMLLLASADAVKELQLPVLGRLVDVQWAGLDPRNMGLGPVHATIPLLHRHHLRCEDIDYWEINEAFSAQVLACLSAFNDEVYCKDELHASSAFGAINSNHLNVDGGAIALGHPVGASGARVVLHLLHVLRRENAKRGVASLCIGGGQGGAILVENVK
jgi:acetyl-CoA C-acetyltransferase